MARQSQRRAGVLLGDGTVIGCGAVVITSGTFLGGVMHRGFEQTIGGRVGDPAAHRLSGSLAELGLHLGRLKTGTPCRSNVSSTLSPEAAW